MSRRLRGLENGRSVHSTRIPPSLSIWNNQDQGDIRLYIFAPIRLEELFSIELTLSTMYNTHY